MFSLIISSVLRNSPDSLHSLLEYQNSFARPWFVVQSDERTGIVEGRFITDKVSRSVKRSEVYNPDRGREHYVPSDPTTSNP